MMSKVPAGSGNDSWVPTLNWTDEYGELKVIYDKNRKKKEKKKRQTFVKFSTFLTREVY